MLVFALRGLGQARSRATGGKSAPPCGTGCWGDAGSNVPIARQGLSSGATASAAGTFHTCAVVDGDVYCWGSNTAGQLGDGSTTNHSTPVQVRGLATGATGIAAGYEHSGALIGGRVACWGENHFGQLGNGSTTSSPVPVPVAFQ